MNRPVAEIHKPFVIAKFSRALLAPNHIKATLASVFVAFGRLGPFPSCLGFLLVKQNCLNLAQRLSRANPQWKCEMAFKFVPDNGGCHEGRYERLAQSRRGIRLQIRYRGNPLRCVELCTRQSVFRNRIGTWTGYFNTRTLINVSRLPLRQSDRESRLSPEMIRKRISFPGDTRPVNTTSLCVGSKTGILDGSGEWIGGRYRT